MAHVRDLGREDMRGLTDELSEFLDIVGVGPVVMDIPIVRELEIQHRALLHAESRIRLLLFLNDCDIDRVATMLPTTVKPDILEL